ncbi:META domain-containing protein [Rhodonellum sp.]|uniref:META domain-containing protein n=1 Tax=Rhodonellum sp. TaxID=2231180 RepID=UPI00271DB2F7|nr:META domain-containing protein [Rhodonellum sp.]MDO9553836.1 META domain-containing protein [Rhodonellum sp.]
MKKLLIAFGFAFTVLACAPEGQPGCPVVYEVKKTNVGIQNSWRLIGFRTKGSGFIDFPPCEAYSSYGNDVDNLLIRLNLTENQSGDGDFELTGNGISNSIRGSYRLGQNQTIGTVGNLSTTKVGGSAINTAYENKYFQAIVLMNSYGISNNILTLEFGEGNEEMIFVSIN